MALAGATSYDTAAAAFDFVRELLFAGDRLAVGFATARFATAFGSAAPPFARHGKMRSRTRTGRR